MLFFFMAHYAKTLTLFSFYICCLICVVSSTRLHFSYQFWTPKYSAIWKCAQRQNHNGFSKDFKLASFLFFLLLFCFVLSQIRQKRLKLLRQWRYGPLSVVVMKNCQYLIKMNNGDFLIELYRRNIWTERHVSLEHTMIAVLSQLTLFMPARLIKSERMLVTPSMSYDLRLWNCLNTKFAWVEHTLDQTSDILWFFLHVYTNLSKW